MLFLKENLLTTKQKSEVVLRYQTIYEFSHFIETGTYQGKMLDLVRHRFEKLYSIEIGKSFFLEAHKRFQSSNVSIFLGDSIEILPILLKRISVPVVFWLDAHYWPSSPFSRGKYNCPIMTELKLLANHPFSHKHVLLIDDYRCFIGKYDYPSEQELFDLINECFPSHLVEVKDDIIRITPIL